MDFQFHIHTGHEELKQYLPLGLLPKEYGGTGKSAREYHGKYDYTCSRVKSGWSGPEPGGILLFYCIEGVVIAAQCIATFLKIYHAPLDLSIIRT